MEPDSINLGRLLGGSITDGNGATGAIRLPALAADIRAAHAAVGAFARFSAERAMAAGAMLIEARALVPHGDWANWLREHVEFSERTARRYAQLVRTGLNLGTVAEMGILGAAESLARVRLPVPIGAQTLRIRTPTGSAFVCPSVEHAGFCWLLAFDDWPADAELPTRGSDVISLKRPIRGDALAIILPRLGVTLDGADIWICDSGDSIDHGWLTGFSQMDPAEVIECATLAAIPRPIFEAAIAASKMERQAPTSEWIIEYADKHVGRAQRVVVAGG